jgi:hypothetical protein
MITVVVGRWWTNNTEPEEHVVMSGLPSGESSMGRSVGRRSRHKKYHKNQCVMMGNGAARGNHDLYNLIRN